MMQQNQEKMVNFKPEHSPVAPKMVGFFSVPHIIHDNLGIACLADV